MKYLLVWIAALALTGCGLLGHAEPWERAVLDDPDATPAAKQEAIQSIEARTAEGINTAAAPFVPAPFQPLVAPLIALAVGLAFKRSREHLLNAASKVGSAVVDATLRAPGLLHTTDDPETLARNAATLKAKAEAKALVEQAKARS